MQKKMAQHEFVGQGRGLEKLAQLVHLDLHVDLFKPGFGVLDGFRRWYESLVDGAGGNLNHKFAHQRSVHGLQSTECGSLLFK